MVAVAVAVVLAGMVMVVGCCSCCSGMDGSRHGSSGTNGSGGIDGDDNNNNYNSCIWGDGSQDSTFYGILNVITLRWLDRLKNDDIHRKYNFLKT